MTPTYAPHINQRKNLLPRTPRNRTLINPIYEHDPIAHTNIFPQFRKLGVGVECVCPSLQVSSRNPFHSTPPRVVLKGILLVLYPDVNKSNIGSTVVCRLRLS